MNLKLARFIDMYIGVPLLYFCWRVKGFSQRRRPAIDTNGANKKILFIKFWGIGNIIMLLPAAATLKKRYPDARIDILTLLNNAAVSKSCKLFDNIYMISNANFPEFISSTVGSFRMLRKVNYDIIVDFEQFARFSALICMLIGKKITVGFNTAGQYRHFVYSKAVKYNNNIHMTKSFFSLIHNAGAFDAAWPGPVPLTCETTDIAEVNEMFLKNGVSDDEACVVMHLSTSENFIERRWPPEYFADLADRLIESFGVRIIFTGLPQDNPLIKKTLQTMKNGSRAIDTSNGLDFFKYISLIKLSDLVISADTAAVHVASSLSVPVVGLYGPNTPVLYGPWSNRSIFFYKKLKCSPCITNYNAKINSCRHPDGRGACMKKISPEEVFAEIKRHYFEKNALYRAARSHAQIV